MTRGFSMKLYIKLSFENKFTIIECYIVYNINISSFT
jgi:hypothetical protein